MLRRLLRGERVWQAHRQHFYQRAVRRGLGHAAVVRRVIAADLLLIGCGWAAENGWGDMALGAAAAIVMALLVTLAHGRSKNSRLDPKIPGSVTRVLLYNHMKSLQEINGRMADWRNSRLCSRFTGNQPARRHWTASSRRNR